MKSILKNLFIIVHNYIYIIVKISINVFHYSDQTNYGRGIAGVGDSCICVGKVIFLSPDSIMSIKGVFIKVTCMF